MFNSVRGKLIPVLITLVALGFALSYVFGFPVSSDRVYSREALQDYPSKIRKSPYDGSLLLQAARHHYHYLRKQLTDPEGYKEGVKSLIIRPLRYYRRIIASQDWTLKRKDKFYLAYLYFQLARLTKRGDGSISNKYMLQARKYALRSHEAGYRSPELMALLGNVHYNLAHSLKDYETALKFYKAVDDRLNDPVLMLNKARTLMTLNRFKAARKVLNRISKFSLPETLRSEYRVAQIELDISQNNYKRALKRIGNTPDNLINVRMRILKAKSLMELGRTDEARKELKTIVEGSYSPKEAEVLLQKINKSGRKNRS